MSDRRGKGSDRTNINDMIRASEVRLINDNGDQLGILSIEEALNTAYEAKLDLVEVAPEAKPPVCRIMDYGRFKYQQSKKTAESKKRTTTIEVKEVKFRPKTGEHDYQFKFRNIERFLNEGNKVKVSMMFRGREIVHSDLGLEVLNRIIEDIKELGEPEQRPKLEGRNMIMVLSPI